ncbi:hypothetical protein N7474_009789 [Penicillium riverlandense]|uniref:uncharacterized protein n=1 Tax=Penicillium riverlandense TaxID=1903569 RepID=UPI0025493CA2|nr:uncharacterized protein N7474_009789 [Penicillium riverlandense]KAJ5808520.1 hypothetical protein N7474_009789 [Penicillium riverlandense]
MAFEFIDNSTTISRAERKRIRSHVAKGRNVGKTIVRPSRKKLAVPRTFSPENKENQPRDREIERQIGDGLSVLGLPAPPTLASKRLVQKALTFFSGPRHAPELDKALDPYARNPATIWTQFIFMDEAYFHCAMAMAITALNSLVVQSEDPADAMRHLALSLRMVNQRLVSPHDALSDTTIAVVIMLSHYERHQGHMRQGQVHFDGLLRMVELRGGITYLAKTKPSIALKLYITDLDYALQLGISTHYSVDDISYGMTTLLDRQDDLEQHRALSPPSLLPASLFHDLGTNLQGLLTDMISFSRIVNDAVSGLRPTFSGYTMHCTLLVLGYRLVGISPLAGPRPDDHLVDTIHLGLAAFMVTFLRRLDRKIAKMPLLSSVARTALDKLYLDEKGAQENQEVLLWFLFLGAASVFRGVDHSSWLVLKARQTLNALDLSSWGDIQEVLVKFPWVHTLHDKAGRELWNRCSLAEV